MTSHETLDRVLRVERDLEKGYAEAYVKHLESRLPSSEMLLANLADLNPSSIAGLLFGPKRQRSERLKVGDFKVGFAFRGACGAEASAID